MDNLGPTPRNVDMDLRYENADDRAGYLKQMHRRREKEKSQKKIIGSKRQFIKPHERKLVLSRRTDAATSAAVLSAANGRLIMSKLTAPEANIHLITI